VAQFQTPAMKSLRRRSRRAVLCTVCSAASLIFSFTVAGTLEAFMPALGDCQRLEINLGRRESMALVGVLPTLSLQRGVHAEETNLTLPEKLRGWQMKLPDGWTVIRSSGVPGPEEVRPKELLSAANVRSGDQGQGAEVRVLRVPLVTTPQDPQGIGGLILIEWFQAEKPRVTQKDVVNSLSNSYVAQPVTFDFSLGKADTKVKDNQRYLTYEFDVTRCEGQQVQGVNGKVCQRPDNGKVLPTSVVHHAVINTVTTEPGGGALSQGKGYPEVLWIVDISAPAEKWENVSKQVAVIFETFAVGDPGRLAAQRNSSAAATSSSLK